MRLSGGFIFSALLAAGIGLFLLWFLHNFDKVPIERHGGAAREARANPLLGAENLLEELGKQVRSVNRLTDVPPEHGTLFLPTPRRKLSDELMANIDAWAYRGGHLLIVVPAEEELAKDRIVEGWVFAGRDYVDEVIARVEVDGWEEPLKVGFSYTFELFDDLDMDNDPVESEHGSHSVTLPYGTGSVTLLSEYTFATNHHIGDNDNAAFLWYLLSLNQSDQIWLVHGVDVPSLWDHLLEDAWMVLVSLATLIGAIIWVSCRRFGPFIPNESIKRRRLLEHIEASGRFLWRYRQSEELLHAVQASLLRSLEFRHPGWVASEDLHRKLGEASGFAREDVKLALTQREVREEHSFTQMVKTLELIRNRL